MTLDAHKRRHQELHYFFDELVADFIARTGKLISQTTILELMERSNEQTKNPVSIEPPKEK